MNFKLFWANMCFSFFLPTFTSGTQQEMAWLRGVCTAGNTLWGCLGSACSRDNMIPKCSSEASNMLLNQMFCRKVQGYSAVEEWLQTAKHE